MRFFAPLGFLALLGIPLILLMYLLKQKHTDKVVSSLFLWKQALVQSQAHQPWQKLRKNLLMFLQISAVVFLALALANPYILGSKAEQNYILALDVSLSMQAKDLPPTRFQAAKESIKKLVETAPPSTKFTLAVMEENPYILISRTTDKKEVLSNLEKLKPTYSGVDWDNGLALLKMEAEQTGSAVRLYTDKAIEQSQLQIEQEVFGVSAENCAVTMLSHVEQENGYQVMVKVKNFGQTAQQRTVTLFGEKEAFDVQEISLAPGAEQDVVFSDVPVSKAFFSAEISPSDALPADDIAYDGVQLLPKKVLLATNNNIFLEKAVSLLPGTEFYKTGPDNIEELSGYDLYIFDGVLPETLPQDGYFMLWNPPNEERLALGKEVEGNGIAAGVPSTGQFRFMKDISFDLGKAKAMNVPWGMELLDWNGQTVAVAGEWDGKKTAVFSFDLHQSDWALKKEFPIFMYQLFGWFFPENLNYTDSITAGEQVEIHLMPDTQKADVALPSGKEITIVPPFPPNSFEQTGEVGIYELKQTNSIGEDTVTYFAINPKTQNESELAFGNSTSSDEEQTVAGVQSSHSIRNALLFILLLFLAAEWRVNCREH